MKKGYVIPGQKRVLKRKATRQHYCYECGESIEPGEEYYEITFVGTDGLYHTAHLCSMCWCGPVYSARGNIEFR